MPTGIYKRKKIIQVCIVCIVCKERFYCYNKTAKYCNKCFIERYRKYFAKRKRDERERNPGLAREKDRRNHIKYRHQRICNSKVKTALDSGKIVKPKRCQKCKKIDIIQGHHEDYTKPFDIIWLCKDCHYGVHHKREKLYGKG